MNARKVLGEYLVNIGCTRSIYIYIYIYIKENVLTSAYLREMSHEKQYITFFTLREYDILCKRGWWNSKYFSAWSTFFCTRLSISTSIAKNLKVVSITLIKRNRGLKVHCAFLFIYYESFPKLSYIFLKMSQFALVLQLFVLHQNTFKSTIIHK